MGSEFVEMVYHGEGAEKGLDALAAHVRQDVLMAGAAAAAQVVYDEIKLNVQPPRIGRKTGNLERSIYRAYSPERSNDNRRTYRLSWNKKTAPHGHLLEYGHWTKTVGVNGPLRRKWVPPRPFMRPSLSAVDRAMEVGKRRMREVLQRMKRVN